MHIDREDEVTKIKRNTHTHTHTYTHTVCLTCTHAHRVTHMHTYTRRYSCTTCASSQTCTQTHTTTQGCLDSDSTTHVLPYRQQKRCKDSQTLSSVILMAGGDSSHCLPDLQCFLGFFFPGKENDQSYEENILLTRTIVHLLAANKQTNCLMTAVFISQVHRCCQKQHSQINKESRL